MATYTVLMLAMYAYKLIMSKISFYVIHATSRYAILIVVDLTLFLRMTGSVRNARMRKRG
jgi:hypothetical protein